jgi:hypothetical protein
LLEEIVVAIVEGVAVLVLSLAVPLGAARVVLALIFRQFAPPPPDNKACDAQ